MGRNASNRYSSWRSLSVAKLCRDRNISLLRQYVRQPGGSSARSSAALMWSCIDDEVSERTSDVIGGVAVVGAENDLP